MKVVINKCFGGFGLSDAVYRRLIDLGVPVVNPDDDRAGLEFVIFDHALRTDQDGPIGGKVLTKLSGTQFSLPYLPDKELRTQRPLIEAIESLGEAASSGRFAELRVVEVPDDVDWEIDEYDGLETVREVSRSWG